MAQGSNGRVDPELVRLRSEVAAARDGVRETLAACSQEARDPFRVKERVRAHPFLTAGVAAGAGYLLYRLRRRRSRADDAPPDAPKRAPGVLESAAAGAAKSLTPLALSMIREWIVSRVADRSDRRK